MGIPDADWKNQERHRFDWLTLLVVGSLVSLYLYLATVMNDGSYVALALVLALWAFIYLTRYWQPVLYLLMAVIIAGVTLAWLTMGNSHPPFERLAIALNVGFLALSIYLFDYEEVRSQLG
ncbi:hypothetical protein [Haloarcula onubensis]|uniref:Uncharacterized protein n=1 Tax=Haloarcula onubensis TaxID=2950539 RepID=A0ABU2FLS4_9EURY|nr:hypothetical protein [Halomicroarcula sp. S3CR25-11]MDS0281261.1 hypothetical protein [Halomicroarcula sp. S3CR25-11]